MRSKGCHSLAEVESEADCSGMAIGGPPDGCRLPPMGTTAVPLGYCSPLVVVGVPAAMALLLDMAVMNDAAST